MLFEPKIEFTKLREEKPCFIFFSNNFLGFSSFFVLFLFPSLSFVFVLIFLVLKIFPLVSEEKIFFSSSFSKSQHKSGHLFCENAWPP